MNIKIKQGNDIKVFECDKNILISDVVKKSGFYLPMPCAGKGRCMKCLVKVEGNVSAPEKHEIEYLKKIGYPNNYRLACKTFLHGDTAIELPTATNAKIITDIKYNKKTESSMKVEGYELGIAIDIGTTTIAAYLFDLSSVSLLKSTSAVNPQTIYGADVISRIEKSLDGSGHELAVSIRTELNRLISYLSEDKEIKKAVITGNTTMLYLLTERDVKSLSSAPFEADSLFGYEISAASLGIAGVDNIYLPNCIAAFAGADLSCAVLSQEIYGSKRKSLIIDIGTNGELYLSTENGAFCCSTAAGPAFEGVGITMGMTASESAIYKVWDEDGEVRYNTIGDSSAAGICGTGVLDAVATFLKLGCIDETGMINKDNNFYIYRNGEKCLKIDDGILLTQGDIRAVQLAKAAIRGGVDTLIHHAGIFAEDLDEVIIAGGFGSSMDISSAVRVGLIPAELEAKSYAVGNASASGAVIVLIDPLNRKILKNIAYDVKYLELSSDSVFSNNFIEAINFC